MDLLSDRITRFLSDCIALLLTKHPLRTSLGALTGIAIIVVDKVAVNLLKASSDPLSAVSQWQVVLFGVFLLHLPTLFRLLGRSSEFPEDVELAFAALQRAKEQGISRTQLNVAYRKVCETILANCVAASQSVPHPSQSESRSEPPVPKR